MVYCMGVFVCIVMMMMDVENNNNDNIGHRESVEFRCQKLDDSTGQWVYGEV